MPASRTSKRTKSKKAVEEVPEDPQQPEEGSSKLPEVVAEVATNVAEVAANVTEAAEEFVDKMTGIEENGKAATEGEEEETGDAKMTNGSEAPKVTMEERKARMEQLRKKIVGLFGCRSVSGVRHLLFWFDLGCF